MAQADYVPKPIRALITGAGAKPSTNPVRAAHAELVAALAGHPRGRSRSILTVSISRTASICSTRCRLI
jgi:hypothetical protein